jgi:hypothetical protein
LFLTIPIIACTLAARDQLRFLKTAVGAPSTLKEWSYHGEPTDRELVHPGSRVVYLTEAANVAVLSMH